MTSRSLTVCNLLVLGFLSGLSCGFLMGCAGTNERPGSAAPTQFRLGSEDPSAYDRSQADSAAYAAEAFTFRKRQPRRDSNTIDFYFKHCALGDDRNYYSKTAYWCNEGPM